MREKKHFVEQYLYDSWFLLFTGKTKLIGDVLKGIEIKNDAKTKVILKTIMSN